MAGFKGFIKQGVFASKDTSTATIVTTGDTFVPIAGAFTNSPIECFHFDTDHLVYDGANGTEFEIDWHTSFSSQDAGRTVHFGVAINGETLVITSPSVMGQFAKNAGQIYVLSGTNVVTLNTGATIQLMVTSDTDADQVTVEHFTTTLAKFFRGS